MDTAPKDVRRVARLLDVAVTTAGPDSYEWLSRLDLEIIAGTLTVVSGDRRGRDELFSLLLGELPPTAGLVEVAGAPTEPGHRQRVSPVAVVGRDASFIPYLTVRENVELARPLSSGEDPDKIFAVTGLGGLVGRPPDDLDDDARLMAALARALVRDPDLIMLRDPTDHDRRRPGEDATGIPRVPEVLRELVDVQGRTLLAGSDDPALWALADERYVVVAGALTRQPRMDQPGGDAE